MEKYATDLKGILATEEQIETLKKMGVKIDESLSYEEAETLIMRNM